MSWHRKQADKKKGKFQRGNIKSAIHSILKKSHAHRSKKAYRRQKFDWQDSVVDSEYEIMEMSNV